MKQDARRNWRRRKQQKTRLARREYFRKKKQAQVDQVVQRASDRRNWAHYNDRCRLGANHAKNMITRIAWNYG